MLDVVVQEGGQVLGFGANGFLFQGSEGAQGADVESVVADGPGGGDASVNKDSAVACDGQTEVGASMMRLRSW